MKWCLKFIEEKDKEGNVAYNVINHSKDWLGMIEYNKRWKLWVFVPDHDTIYSAGCNEIITNKLKDLDSGKQVGPVTATAPLKSNVLLPAQKKQGDKK